MPRASVPYGQRRKSERKRRLVTTSRHLKRPGSSEDENADTAVGKLPGNSMNCLKKLKDKAVTGKSFKP